MRNVGLLAAGRRADILRKRSDANVPRKARASAELY
jgi:hypothetical protein